MATKKPASSQKTTRAKKPRVEATYLSAYRSRTRQTGTSKEKNDDARQGKPPGWRRSAKGNWYYEARLNRSDNLSQYEKYHQVKAAREEKGKKGLSLSADAIIRNLRKQDINIRKRNALRTPKEKWNLKVLTDAELLEVAREYGRKIDTASIEHGILLDECGNCFLHEIGKEDKVEYDLSDFEKAKLVLHNHPDGGNRDFFTPHSSIDVANLFYEKTPKFHMVVAHGRWYNYAISSPGKPFIRKAKLPFSPKGVDGRVYIILRDVQEELMRKLCQTYHIDCEFSGSRTKRRTTLVRLLRDMPISMVMKIGNRAHSIKRQNRWQVLVSAHETKVLPLLNTLGERRFKFTKGDL